MNSEYQNFEEEEINLREEIQKYLKYWPWFLVSVFVAVVLAFIYLKLSKPVYLTNATIIRIPVQVLYPARSNREIY